jgi:hypothetical protein
MAGFVQMGYRFFFGAFDRGPTVYGTDPFFGAKRFAQKTESVLAEITAGVENQAWWGTSQYLWAVPGMYLAQ